MLDTLRQVETPEGVTLYLRIAGVVPRAAAWAVDAVIRFFLAMIVLSILGAVGKGGMGIALMFIFVVYWFYPVLFEVLNRGRTPGKILMNLRVVNDNALPVGWMASLNRNLLRTVDMFPVLYGFGLVSMLLDRDFRRLGDRVAGTLVVHDGRPHRSSVPKVTRAAVPPVPLGTEDQVALLSFAERTGYLTAERQNELADILVPVTGQAGEAGVRQLIAYASWITGRG